MGEIKFDDSVQIQAVQGGFIMITCVEGQHVTEVFVSPGKLLKAVRSFVDDHSAKKEVETAE